MTQPLALVLYERVLPGSQIVNRLQDLGYRVQALSDAGKLVEAAEQAKPMVVLADLETGGGRTGAALGQLKAGAATRHLPVIAFGGDKDPEVQAAAQKAGVNLVVSEAAILGHLAQFLDQALQVD
jgi:CheY-like chemotaxis protein